MNLEQYRKEIDELDNQLADLLNKRMDIVKKIADYKKREGLSVGDSNRENEIITRVCSGEHEAILRNIFTCIFKASREHQEILIEAEKGEAP